MAAEGGGFRDERRGSSASEVGTDDETANKKEGITKVTIFFFHRGPCGLWMLYSKSPLRRRVSLGGQLPASVAKAFVIAPASSLRYFFSSFFFLLLLFVVVAFC